MCAATGPGWRKGEAPAIAAMTNEELAWLAGLLEGEGAFVAGSTHARVSVALHMTDLDVVEKAATLMGSKVTGPFTRKDQPSHWKPSWRTSVQDIATAEALCCRLLPLMGERRRTQIARLLARTAEVQQRRNGSLTERSGAGLQIPLARFESAVSL